MSRAIAKLQDIAIADNTADGRIVGKNEFEDAVSLMISAPAAITGGGVPVVQITFDDPPTVGGLWSTLTRSAADVGAPAAGKSKAIGDDNFDIPACTAFRIHGTANFTGGSGGFTTFKCYKQYEV